MAKVEKVVQFNVAIPKGIGTLAEALDLVSASGINGRAFAAWEEPKRGTLMLVANDPKKTEKALKAAEVKYQKAPALAVTVKNRRGSGRRMAQILADAGINIMMAHASALGSGNYLTILMTSNDTAASKVLRAM
jgi:hypothetical protein